jgi:hypothetical protein
VGVSMVAAVSVAVVASVVEAGVSAAASAVVLADMAADITEITEITGTPTATAVIMAMTMRAAVISFAAA